MWAIVPPTELGRPSVRGWYGDGFSWNTGSALFLLTPFPCDSWDDMRRLDILDACTAIEQVMQAHSA